MGSQSLRQLREQRRVIELATEFLSLAPRDVDAGLERGLAVAAEIAGADRVRIVGSAEYVRADRLQIEWPAGPHSPAAAAWSEHEHTHPWSHAELSAGRPVHVSDTAERTSSEAGAVDRRAWREAGVRAYLALPLMADSRLIGMLECERVDAPGAWSEHAIGLLGLIAGVYASALQRRHSESERTAVDHRMALVGAHGSDALMEFTMSGRPIYMSPGVEDLMGYTPEEMMSESLLFGVHPDDATLVRDQYARMLDEDSTLAAVVRVYAKDGSLRYVEGEGHVYETILGERRIVAVARDVTRRERHARQIEARLEVETMISELSRRFMGQSIDDVTHVIRDALKRASAICGADRCILVSAPKVADQSMRFYEWESEATSDLSHFQNSNDARPFKWMIKQMLQGRMVKIADVADLPPEAEAEREKFLERGTASYLAIPVLGEGLLIGTLCFEYFRAHHDWDDHELAVLRLLAELFEGVLRRQRDEEARRDASRFREAQIAQEQRIAELSRYFLDLDASLIAEGITKKLHVLGELAGVDRVRVIAFDGDGGHAERYAWEGGTGEAVSMPLELEKEDRFPWARQHTIVGRTFQIESPDALPLEADAERQDLIERGVVSQLVIPLVVETRYVCIVGLETTREKRTWTEEQVTRLKLAGEIFASALRRLRAMVELKDSQTQLIQSQKMEAVGTLAGGIAHDFNNQLAVMLGNTRFCLESTADDDSEQRAALEDIERAAQHCAELTAGLLAFSRHSPGDPRSIETPQLIGDVRSLVVPLLPATIGLAIEVEPGVAPIFGNPTQLQQVLINLVVNARDAMREGGHLQINARNVHVGPEEARALGLTIAGAHVEIAVEDDGVGMDQLVIGRIFEPFFTTKEVGRGTGLGLATAYGIVQQAGGAITVQSEVGKGSRFRVLLPCAVDEVETESRDADYRPRGLSGLVLLVEDEPAVRRVLRRMLEARGLRVIEALNGEDGLRTAMDLVKPPDILVTDMTMPEMGGAELARAVRNRHPRLPVLFLSGYPDGAIESEFAESGPTRFVQKPFGDRVLFGHLEALLEAGAADPAPAA